jgi:hypothetical protein
MIISGLSVLASPDMRLLHLKVGETNNFFTKAELETFITYLKGLRDGMADSTTVEVRPFGFDLNRADLETFVTYLKGVRDGRGWNNSNRRGDPA